jgi:hypothetical protein
LREEALAVPAALADPSDHALRDGVLRRRCSLELRVALRRSYAIRLAIVG